MYWLILFGILVAAIIMIFHLHSWEDIRMFLTSEVTCTSNRCYQTVGMYKNTQQAAEMLEKINRFNVEISRYLRNKYIFENIPDQPEYFNLPYKHRRGMVRYILDRYNPDNLIENAPVSDVNTSYVEDKGKVFAMCLREKESGEHNFHADDILQFVTLHEMAHLATVPYSHPPIYWANFKSLLIDAYLSGLYKPIDYSKKPIVYCSLHINYNPIFDDAI